MIIEVKVSGIRLVSPDMDTAYSNAYVVVGKDVKTLFDNDSVIVRKALVDACGDGEKMYIVIPDKASEYFIHVDCTESKAPHRSQRKSTIESSADLKILYKREV